MSTATTGDQPSEARETAPCTKCMSEIPVKADRCPECGFEPSTGILGGIVMWIAFSIGMLFALIAVVSIILVFDGFPLTDAFYVFAFTGTIAAICFGLVYQGYQTSERGPTDKAPGQDRESKSMSESWQDGAERGEAIADRVNNTWPAIVAVLPTWTWTAGVVLSAVLNFSVWVTAVQENETGMLIGIAGGGLLAVFSILADSKRLNWSNDEWRFRWWFWSILAVIPLIGWLFGLAWLARKRQKTGSIV